MERRTRSACRPHLFIGANVVNGRYERLIRTVDIAPTLALLIGISHEPMNARRSVRSSAGERGGETVAAPIQFASTTPQARVTRRANDTLDGMPPSSANYREEILPQYRDTPVDCLLETQPRPARWIGHLRHNWPDRHVHG